eukprot:11789454-Heterocapsa_arctica.AAC.1
MSSGLASALEISALTAAHALWASFDARLQIDISSLQLLARSPHGSSPPAFSASGSMGTFAACMVGGTIWAAAGRCSGEGPMPSLGSSAPFADLERP